MRTMSLNVLSRWQGISIGLSSLQFINPAPTLPPSSITSFSSRKEKWCTPVPSINVKNTLTESDIPVPQVSTSQTTSSISQCMPPAQKQTPRQLPPKEPATQKPVH